MKIVLYTPRVWDSTWGQEKNLVEELANHHQILMIDVIDYGLRYASKLQGQPYPVPDGVKIIKRRTKLQAGVLLGIYTELGNLWDFIIGKEGYVPVKSDVLMTYLTSGVILTTLLAKCLRKKIVLIYADDYAEFFRSKSSLVAWVTEHIGTPIVAKLSDHIVSTAHKLKEDIERFNPHITVIPNGVYVKKLERHHSGVLDSNFPIPNSKPFTVGFVGGFGTWVDFEMVLTVAQSLPDVHFKLIGSGDQFEDVCSRTQSFKNVWVPGILPYHKVLEELATMDVCLIPFKINRITDRVSPIKLFEYWAMKKPVISTRFYEVQKIAEGKVFFVDSANDLKGRIVELQEQPEIGQKMAEIGFQAVHHYDWSRLGRQYLQIIDNL